MLALGVGNSIEEAATITPTHDIHHITAAAVHVAITTINPPSPEFAGMLLLIADLGNGISLDTGGNIKSSGGISTNKVGVLVYDPNTSKWYTPQGG